MADRDEILRDQTYKGQCDGDDRRIFYTLTDKKEMTTHRIAKAVTLVLVHLQKKNLLDEDELDELLLDCIQ